LIKGCGIIKHLIHSSYIAGIPGADVLIKASNIDKDTAQII